MYPEDSQYENKILDLTSQKDEGEGPGYICDQRQASVFQLDTRVGEIQVLSYPYPNAVDKRISHAVNAAT